MVWGILGYYRVGELVVLQGYVDESYMEVLSDNLMESVTNIFGDNQHTFIFQQANATPHIFHATQRWLDDNDSSHTVASSLTRPLPKFIC
jgi:hypothetical protein